MKITDGKRTVEIEITSWEDGRGWSSPDWSADFFDAGALPYDEDADAHVVDDVRHCIDEVIDYLNGRGDYYTSALDLARSEGYGDYAEYIANATDCPVAVIDGVMYEYGDEVAR